ncbi:jg15239 [Pararge aegeria aegeria]|uniref:Jg15239 protein n=1 Tax=Pararge aegeria aegeria TaxID=348720 RepID=A0A8S4RD23_9NEOP|nr:jg15239 [Pararge aegeria aegeria]
MKIQGHHENILSKNIKRVDYAILACLNYIFDDLPCAAVYAVVISWRFRVRCRQGQFGNGYFLNKRILWSGLEAAAMASYHPTDKDVKLSDLAFRCDIAKKSIRGMV